MQGERSPSKSEDSLELGVAKPPQEASTQPEQPSKHPLLTSNMTWTPAKFQAARTQEQVIVIIHEWS